MASDRSAPKKYFFSRKKMFSFHGHLGTRDLHPARSKYSRVAGDGPGSIFPARLLGLGRPGVHKGRPGPQKGRGGARNGCPGAQKGSPGAQKGPALRGGFAQKQNEVPLFLAFLRSFPSSAVVSASALGLRRATEGLTTAVLGLTRGLLGPCTLHLPWDAHKLASPSLRCSPRTDPPRLETPSPRTDPPQSSYCGPPSTPESASASERAVFLYYIFYNPWLACASGFSNSKTNRKIEIDFWGSP